MTKSTLGSLSSPKKTWQETHTADPEWFDLDGDVIDLNLPSPLTYI